MARPPRIPNWLPWEKSTVYFITFCVTKRRPLLANPKAWRAAFATFKRLNAWQILGAIAMPDHLHILAGPLDREASVSAFSRWFKRWFNEVYHEGANCGASVSDAAAAAAGVSQKRPTIWQEGCFDRLLRSDESLAEKWEYLRQNPSRAGLVSAPEDWPYQFAFNADDAKL